MSFDCICGEINARNCPIHQNTKEYESMSKYKNWNIKDLLAEQLEITSEITARIKTVEMMDSNYHTYTPNADAQSYKTLMEAGMDLLRKGQQNDEL